MCAEVWKKKLSGVDCDYDYDAGLAAAEELIRRYPDTDGILASNDMAAMAVYKVLHQNGRRVPEDVQLVGFDNIEFSRRMTPELTTISQPIEEMGKLAVQMIIHHGEEISYQKENIFDVELIRRQTNEKERRSRMKLAVVGSINMDMTVTAERIPLKGETLRGDSFIIFREGKVRIRRLLWQSSEQKWRCSDVLEMTQMVPGYWRISRKSV